MVGYWKQVLIALFLAEFGHTKANQSFSNRDQAKAPAPGSIWDSLWKLSCDHVSNHLESSPVHRAKRSSADKLNSNIDFDDPEQLFNYLYPLAHVQAKDLIKRSTSGGDESGRSNNIPHEYSVSSLMADLLEFWQTECELREISKDGDNESVRERQKEDADVNQAGDVKKKNEDEIENIVAEVDDNGNVDGTDVKKAKSRSSRVLQAGDFQVTSFSVSPRADSDQIERPDQTPSMRSYFNSFEPGTSPATPIRPGPNRRRRRRKKKTQPGISATISSRSDSSDDEALSATSTDASVTSTTAAPNQASEDDSFFSSYGGDIEYFFPLLSFGIPFDGEITFLGFHGFKGIFPHRR